MKSSIDNTPPPKMPLSWRNELERVWLASNLKVYICLITLSNKQRRVQALIEQDNRLLLDRLATAMSMKNIDNEPKKGNYVQIWCRAFYFLWHYFLC